MRYRELAILTGVIAALGFAQTSASALDLLGGRVTVDLGDKDAIDANVGARLSNNTSATAGVDLSGAHTASINANIDTGTNVARSLSADAVIDLSDDDFQLTVDLNGDGVIDGDDTALLVKLDINGDGIVNILDDANGDGIIAEADIGINLSGIGGTIDKLLTDVTSAPPEGGVSLPLANTPSVQLSANNIAAALREIDDHDVTALKVKCADVLADSVSYDATTVGICQALASL